MDQRVIIQQGDCIASLAYKAGLLPETIWQHPENAQLREKRADMHALLPGDAVFVPAPRPRSESCALDARHRFRRRGVPAELAVQFVVNGHPRANVEYTLIIDGVPREGSTDGDGWIREPISPDARTAAVRLRPKDEPEEYYELQLGHMDPHNDRVGALERLANLGYLSSTAGEADDDMVHEAVTGFQKAHGLDATGELDESTMHKLQEIHGS